MKKFYRARILNKGLSTHTRRQCRGQKCCLHNPSRHHMRDWPIFIRMDKGTLAERVCEHHVGHPDSDSVRFLDPTGERGLAIHGCCGCCFDTTKGGLK